MRDRNKQKQTTNRQAAKQADNRFEGRKKGSDWKEERDYLVAKQIMPPKPSAKQIKPLKPSAKQIKPPKPSAKQIEPPARKPCEEHSHRSNAYTIAD